MSLARRSLLAFFATIPTALAAPCCGVISPTAARLLAFLDRSGVDHLWLSGTRVDWRTGAPSSGPLPNPGGHTHCSAFVASASMQLGIYVLRPPAHSENLLASAQMGWMRGADAAEKGWRQVPDALAAQTRANVGDLVLAAVENPNPHKPGHIAIVRPGDIDRATLLADGPFVTQAGTRNALSEPVRLGFRGHPGAWVPNGTGTIGFFAHSLAGAII